MLGSRSRVPVTVQDPLLGWPEGWWDGGNPELNFLPVRTPLCKRRHGSSLMYSLLMCPKGQRGQLEPEAGACKFWT